MRLKIGLIFSLDYEIHGNGSGEFKNWAHLPTAQMLDLFDTYGAKLTIMAEMGHYWAMKRYESIFKDDISLFESQLINAVERGHDVQFHFHPQWIDAKYEGGTWQMDFSRKTIERLCLDYNEAFLYLSKGKEALQSLLTPVNPEYQCICFRAGFLQMQPSENILRALADTGFLSDSSVSKGMKTNNGFVSIDYSSAYSNYRPWKISGSDICKNNENGEIYEFPVLSTYAGLKDKILNRLGNLIRKGKKIDEIISQFMLIHGKWMAPPEDSGLSLDKLKRAVGKRWFYIDFCSRNHSDLTHDLKKVISASKKIKGQNYIPVVLIGHSKDFFFSNNLSEFLKACKGKEEVEFITYSGAVRKYTMGKN